MSPDEYQPSEHRDSEPLPDGVMPDDATQTLLDPERQRRLQADGDESLPETQPPPAAPAKPPSLVCRSQPEFRLLKVVGTGGFGRVWEAVQVGLGRHVAIKQLRDDRLYDGVSPDELRCEARISSLLDHPNIVPIYALSDDEEGNPLVAMKLVTGEGWNTKMQQDRAAMAREDFIAVHVDVLRSVAQAVAFAHGRGVVHRDLKPSQVRLGEYGEVLLMDWGLAILFDPNAVPGITPEDLDSLPAVGTARGPCGTPAYMAPEQTEADMLGIGPWTDVFLLGAILYEILTGRPPHADRDARQAFLRAARDRVRLPEHPEPSILVSIAMKALERDRTKRHRDGREFLGELDAYLTGSQRRREAAERLEAARKCAGAAEPSYADFNRALAECGRALALWPEYAAAREAEQELLERYAQAALGGGDLNLARAQADRLDGATRTGLQDAIATAATTRLARERQRRALSAIAAILFVAVAAAGLLANRNRIEADRQRDAARHAQAQADDRRREAEDQRMRAEASRAETEGLVEFMLGDLKDRLKPIGRLDVMDAVLARVEESLDRQKSRPGELRGSRISQRLLSLMSGVRADQGRIEEAVALSRRAVADAEAAVAQYPGDREAREDLFSALDILGNTYFAQGARKEALAQFERALGLHRSLVESGNSPGDNRLPEARLTSKIGSAKLAIGDLDGALQAFESCAAMLRQLAAESPADVEKQLALGEALSTLSDVLRARGELEQASKLQREVLAIRRGLVERHPDDAGLKRELVEALHESSKEASGQGRLPEAILASREAYGLAASRVAFDPTNISRKHDLAAIALELGSLLEKSGESAEGDQLLAEGISLLEQVALADPDNVLNQMGFAVALGYRGDSLGAQGKADEAKECYLRSLAIIEALVAKEPENFSVRRELAALAFRYAETANDLGLVQEARSRFQQSIEVFRALALADPSNVEIRGDLATVFTWRGVFEEEEGEVGSAREAFLEAAALRRAIAAQDPSNLAWKDWLADALQRVASASLEKEHQDDGTRAAREAVALREELVAAEPADLEQRNLLASASLQLADSLCLQSSWEEAEAILRRTLALREELVAASSDDVRFLTGLGLVCQRIGAACESQGDLECALQFGRRALEILEPIMGADSPGVATIRQRLVKLEDEARSQESTVP